MRGIGKAGSGLSQPLQTAVCCNARTRGVRCHKQDGEVVCGKVLIIGHDHWVWEKVTAEKGALGSKSQTRHK